MALYKFRIIIIIICLP